MNPIAWKRLCLDAATYIENHGWHQGSYFDRQERACIFGAFAVLADKHPLKYGGVPKKAEVELEALLGMAVSVWNDQPGRTMEEVVGMLRKIGSSR
jgi:hypothetical protein